jgi:hypothetical protein
MLLVRLFRLFGKIFYYITVVPLLFSARVFKSSIEKWGNSIELFVYRFRNPIIFISIFYILSFFSGLLSFSSISKMNELFVGVSEPVKKVVGVNFLTTNIFWIFIVILIFEIMGQVRKLFANQLKKLEIITPSERLFSLLPYFWLWLEFTNTYFDYVLDFLDGWITPEQKLKVFEFCTNLFSTYGNLPGTSYGLPGYGLFFLFYFGIGRNKEKFSFFIRYHYINGILTSAIFGFITHLFFLWVKHQPVTEITNFVGSTTYSFFFLIICIGCIASLFGRETKIPFIHQAIFYHTGRKEDDGSINLDDLR